MKNITWFFFCISLFHCSNGSIKEKKIEPALAKAGHEKIYVTAASLLDSQHIDDARHLRIVISGTLPSPAYKLQGVKQNIDGNIIELMPYAHYNKNAMAAQMLVPCQDTVAVKIGKIGTYKIRLIGRQNTIENTIEVK